MSGLPLLPSMRSNTEIADELFISVNTVKAHLKSLLPQTRRPQPARAIHLGHALRLINRLIN